MATKGVPIDISKRYKTKDGYKIIKLELRNASEVMYTNYPIKACVLLYDGTEGSYSYTFDGFFYQTYENSGADLILDEEQEPEQPKEIKKRKVVQIAATHNGDCDVLFALCDDGKIYSSFNRNSWQESPSIPQDENI